eukprot:2636928-Rhodomonas_salina.1
MRACFCGCSGADACRGQTGDNTVLLRMEAAWTPLAHDGSDLVTCVQCSNPSAPTVGDTLRLLLPHERNRSASPRSLPSSGMRGRRKVCGVGREEWERVSRASQRARQRKRRRVGRGRGGGMGGGERGCLLYTSDAADDM